MVTKKVYGARPTKRKRRTRAELDALREAIHRTLAADHPMTVRQVFYRLVSQGVIEKTEQEYKNAVGRLLLQMRVDGAVPFGWIADNTRWMRKPDTYSSLEEALADTARVYRRSLWDWQDAYVEIWTEKDALAGVLLQETSRWDVPLMVTKGFSSVTYLYEAAEAITGEDKTAFLYYFGDHDPSGIHIDRVILRRLRQFAPRAEIHFSRVAVLPEQITGLGLPTRPTKRTDSRSKDFVGESVEVDAIEPARLRLMVRECIERHIDRVSLQALKQVEKKERETLLEIAQRFQPSA